MVGMETTARLLQLLAMLQARPNWSGEELAQRLEVTGRTLRRDINRLRELGYPVEATPGRYGGYRLVAGGAIPPLLLTEDEAVVVAWGLRAAAAGGLPGFEDPALLALAKIEQVLPERLRARIQVLTEATVRLGGGFTSDGPLDVHALVTIAQASRTPERMRFTYVDGSGRESERHVEPYRLVHGGRRWYLFAWDRDREDWRSFRVDRMRDVHPTGMRFEHRESPDPAAFVAEGLAVNVYRLQGRVMLHVPLEVARRLISPTVGVLEEDGERTVMRIGADEPEWLARYLAGLPCSWTLLEPDEVREAVANLADRLRSAAARPG